MSDWRHYGGKPSGDSWEEIGYIAEPQEPLKSSTWGSMMAVESSHGLHNVPKKWQKVQNYHPSIPNHK